MKKSIYKKQFYAAPIDRVWAAITQPELLSHWFMQADFEPIVGYNFTFRDEPRGKWDGILVGEVLLAEPPSRLEYTWKGDQMTNVTTVQWQLIPQGEGTLVTLSHTGFDGFSDMIIGFFHQAGWNRYLRQLSAHLETTEL